MDEEKNQSNEEQQPEQRVNQAPSEDGASNDRVIAALAYLLFFLPLVVNPDDEFGKFHANQGLNLLIAALIVNAIGTIVPVLGWFIVLPLGNLAVIILAILGFVKALNGERKELPVIGKYRLIK